MFSEKVLEAARLAWVELSSHMDENPTPYKDNNAFVEFYNELIDKLFEEKAED